MVKFLKKNNKINCLIVLLALTFSASLFARQKRKVKKKQTKKTVVQEVPNVNDTVTVVRGNPLLTKPSEACKYRLWIEGPECRICAKTAVVELSKLPGLQDPQYLWIDNDFKKSHVVCQMEPKALDLASIETLLINQKFTLQGIQGSFCGLLRQHGNGTWYFMPVNSLRKFDVGNPKDQHFEKLKKKRTLLRKPICLQGTLYLVGNKPSIYAGK